MAQQLDDKRPVFDHSATPNVGRMPTWIRQRLGGDEHYAHTAAALRELARRRPDIGLEILTPDFRGCQLRAVDVIHAAVREADTSLVWAHNVETVPAMYKTVRKGSDYERALRLLGEVACLSRVEAKSALMLGLGEHPSEVLSVLRDLRTAGVQRLSLGQYLRPSHKHLPVKEYIAPAQFDEYAAAARALVRSSYHAEERQSQKGG